MKLILIKTLFAFFLMGTNISLSNAQQNPFSGPESNPWSKTQLMQPAVLAKMIASRQKIRIYNIGVVDDIKGAINLGAASEHQNLEKFKKALNTIPKNETIVVYCGCCPMDKCPNIRPAFQMLKDQGFSKPFLLNLPVNLKTDWINKGFPLAKGD